MTERGSLIDCVSKALHHSATNTLMMMLQLQESEGSWQYRAGLVKGTIETAQAQMSKVAGVVKEKRVDLIALCDEVERLLKVAMLDFDPIYDRCPRIVVILSARSPLAVAQFALNQMLAMVDEAKDPEVYQALTDKTLEFGHKE